MNSAISDQQETSTAKLSRRERNLLSESVRVEEELLPGFVRPTLFIIALMVCSFIFWAAYTEVTEVSVASGELTPSGDIKVVQHLDGGIIEEIIVGKNAQVQKGEVLARIRSDRAEAELLQMQARLTTLDLQTERLKALTEKRSPNFSFAQSTQPGLILDQQKIFEYQIATRDSKLNILDRQIEQNQERLKQLQNNLSSAIDQRQLSAELLTLRETLAKRKLIDRATLIETRREDLSAKEQIKNLSDEIEVVNRELAEVESRYTDTTNQLQQDALSELGSIQSERAEVVEIIKNLEAQIARLIIRSPAEGQTHNVKIHTIGQVIQPGELLLEVVPNHSELIAEVQIAPKDIGHIRIGQNVNVRVSSYDFTRFGAAEGILVDISPTNFIAEDGSTYFLGKVKLAQSFLGDDPNLNPLQIGMTVDADILTGEKTLLTYLLKPVTQALSNAFRER